MMATKTKTKTRKLIKTQAERKLADALDFRGKYIDTLLENAAKHCKLEDGDRLPNAQSYLALMARQRAARIKSKWGIGVLAFERLVAKGKEILRDFRTGYSMGELKTMKGGEHWFVRIDDRQEYANSSRYKATHGSLTIKIDLLSLRKIERIQGVWTVRRGGNRASWLQSEGSKNRYSVRWVHGYLVGNSHGATLEECRALEDRKAIRSEDGAIKFLNRFVGFRDRVLAGACSPGVVGFCQRNGLDPEMGYRIDYLLGLKDPVARPYLEALAKRLQR